MLPSEGFQEQPASKQSLQHMQQVQQQPQQFQQLLDQQPASAHTLQLQHLLLQTLSNSQAQQQQQHPHALAAVLQALAPGNPALAALGALLQLLPAAAGAAAPAVPSAAAPAELAAAALSAAQGPGALGQLVNQGQQHHQQQHAQQLLDEPELLVCRKRGLEPEQQLNPAVDHKKAKLLLDVSNPTEHDIQQQQQHRQQDRLPQQPQQQSIKLESQPGLQSALLQDTAGGTPGSTALQTAQAPASSAKQQAVQASEHNIRQWLQCNTSPVHTNITTDQQTTNITLTYSANAEHMLAQLGSTLLQVLQNTEYQVVDPLSGFVAEAGQGADFATVAHISVTRMGVLGRKELQPGQQQQMQQLMERIQQCVDSNPALQAVKVTLSGGATAWCLQGGNGLEELRCPLSRTYHAAAAPFGDDHDIAAALLLLSGSQPPPSIACSKEEYTPPVQLVQLRSAARHGLDIRVPWFSDLAPTRVVLSNGAQAAVQLECSVVAGSSNSSSRVLQVHLPAGVVCDEGFCRVLLEFDGAYFVAAVVGCFDVHHQSLQDIEAWLSQDPNLVTHFELFHANTSAAASPLPQHKAHLQRPAGTVFNITDFLVGSCIHPPRPAVLRVLLSMLDRVRGSEVCDSFVRSRQMSFELFGADSSETSQVIKEFIQQHAQHSSTDQGQDAALQQQHGFHAQWQQQQQQYKPAGAMQLSSGDGSSTMPYDVQAAMAAGAAAGYGTAADASGQTYGQQESLAAHMAHAVSNRLLTQPVATQSPSSKLASSSPTRPAAARGTAAAGAAGAAAAAMASMPKLLDLNLPKPKVKSWQLNALSGQGIEGDQEISMHFYMKRGPQAMRRTLVRRLTVMFPQVDNVYTMINTNAGLSQKGQQWLQSHCEEFFTQVLGPPNYPGSAPWPLAKELKPVVELGYISRLLTWMLSATGRTVSVEDVNSCFVPGHHDWKVDPSRLEALLGVSVKSVGVPLYPLPTSSAAAISPHCDPAAAAAMQVPAAAAAAVAGSVSERATGAWEPTAAAAADTSGDAMESEAKTAAAAAAAAAVQPPKVAAAGAGHGAAIAAQPATDTAGDATAAAAEFAGAPTDVAGVPAMAPGSKTNEPAAAVLNTATLSSTAMPAAMAAAMTDARLAAMTEMLAAAAAAAMGPSSPLASPAAAAAAAAATSPPVKGIPVAFPAAGLPVAPVGLQSPTAGALPAAMATANSGSR